MVLERRRGVNIKDLSLKSPDQRPGIFFDPLRDITPADRVRMLQRMERMKDGNEYTSMDNLRELLILNLISPLQNHRHLNDYFADQLTEEIKYERKEHFLTPSLLGQYATLKMLDPSRFADLGLEARVWSGLKAAFEGQIDMLNSYQPGISSPLNEDTVWNLTGDLANLKIIFPQYQDDMGLTGRAWGALEEVYDISRQHQESGLIAADLFTHASNLRLLFPDKFKNLKFGPTQWDRAKKYLDTQRNNEDGDYYLFTDIAFELLIVHAKDVIITPEKVDIILPDQGVLVEAKQPMPEQRRF